MLTWINELIDRLPGFLKAAFRGVARFFLAPWRLLQLFFREVKATTLKFWHAAGRLKDGVIAIAFWTGRAIWHVANRIMPRAIQNAINLLVRWVTKGLDVVLGKAVGLVNALQRWVILGLNGLRSFVRDILTWATARISELFNWIARVGNRVADLVLHPEKLALWILPALWGPLWRFLDSRAEPIGRWLLGRSIAATLRAAGTIERVIARIL